MKKYFKFLPFLFLGLCLILNSCSADEVNEEPNIVVKSNSEEPINLNPLKTAVKSLFAYVDQKEDPTNYLNNLTETEATILLQPVIDETLNILPQYGISHSELQEDIALDDSRIASIGIGIIAINVGTAQYEVESADWDKVIECAVAVIGFNARDLITDGIQSGVRMAVKALVKNVAIRVAGGPIGVALTVAEFTFCYNDWSLW